jgi:AcrR family transcriptional regulator
MAGETEHVKYKKSEQTRARLMSAAMTVIQKKGYKNTTIRDICEEASMSVGAFYGQFQNKAELLAEYYGSHTKEATWGKLPLSGSCAREKILDFSRNYALLNIGTEVEHLRVILAEGSTYAPINTVYYDSLLAALEDGKQSGEIGSELSAKELHTMIMTFLRGCIFDWCLMDGAYDLESRILTYMEILLSSLSAKKANSEQ